MAVSQSEAMNSFKEIITSRASVPVMSCQKGALVAKWLDHLPFASEVAGRFSVMHPTISLETSPHVKTGKNMSTLC